MKMKPPRGKSFAVMSCFCRSRFQSCRMWPMVLPSSFFSSFFSLGRGDRTSRRSVLQQAGRSSCSAALLATGQGHTRVGRWRAPSHPFFSPPFPSYRPTRLHELLKAWRGLEILEDGMPVSLTSFFFLSPFPIAGRCTFEENPPQVGRLLVEERLPLFPLLSRQPQRRTARRESRRVRG